MPKTSRRISGGAEMIDLRSDTVTQPTPAMRRAMAEAEVGDDQYGEDPTVRELEERYADVVGKESAMFVPSGTMANQVALRLLGTPGTLVVAGRNQHLVIYEYAAAATNSGAQLHLVDDDDGTVAATDVAAVLDSSGYHHPQVSAVFVENTHLRSGGRPWSLEALDALAALGLPVHVDGARLFNASIATGVAPDRLVAGATTVMTCLSKGLAAPVGSVLAGPAEAMAEARVHRHRLGGAMRQAGVIAAAGLVALDQMVERLADDHRRARTLAEAVAERWPACGLVPDEVRTNMVVFEHPDTRALLDHLANEGVLADTIDTRTMRFVTHCDVDDDGIEQARKAIAGAP
jgi:threonine aldolase